MPAQGSKGILSFLQASLWMARLWRAASYNFVLVLNRAAFWLPRQCGPYLEAGQSVLPRHLEWERNIT